jgi:hypothetical protein
MTMVLPTDRALLVKLLADLEGFQGLLALAASVLGFALAEEAEALRTNEAVIRGTGQFRLALRGLLSPEFLSRLDGLERLAAPYLLLSERLAVEDGRSFVAELFSLSNQVRKVAATIRNHGLETKQGESRARGWERVIAARDAVAGGVQAELHLCQVLETTLLRLREEAISAIEGGDGSGGTIPPGLKEVWADLTRKERAIVTTFWQRRRTDGLPIAEVYLTLGWVRAPDADKNLRTHLSHIAAKLRQHGKAIPWARAAGKVFWDNPSR